MINFNPTNSISFKATITREPKKICKDGYYEEAEPTKKDIIDSYDNVIKKIEAYKQFAIKLDNLLFEDKDIKEKIASLPDDIEIEVSNAFYNDTGCNGDEDSIEIGNLGIGCYTDNIEGQDSFLSFEYSEEGPSKEKILEFLDEANYENY